MAGFMGSYCPHRPHPMIISLRHASQLNSLTPTTSQTGTRRDAVQHRAHAVTLQSSTSARRELFVLLGYKATVRHIHINATAVCLLSCFLYYPCYLCHHILTLFGALNCVHFLFKPLPLLPKEALLFVRLSL